MGVVEGRGQNLAQCPLTFAISTTLVSCVTLQHNNKTNVFLAEDKKAAYWWVKNLATLPEVSFDTMKY